MNNPSVVPEVVEQIMMSVNAVHGLAPIVVPILVACLTLLLVDLFVGERTLLSGRRK